MTVQVRPFPTNPFQGVNNPSLPVPNGGAAGTFNAFGWLRELVNSGIGQSINELNAQAGVGSGVFV